MRVRQPLPQIWLLTDERNDAWLQATLAKLPEGSGVVYRHYHLEAEARRARFDELHGLCRKLGLVMILSGDTDMAAEWSADGAYGPPERLAERHALLRLATVHNAQEIRRANRAGVDGMFLSPVFPTRSHPEAACLGRGRFLALAAEAHFPVIALGGMNPQRAAALDWPRWAAIDGFSQGTKTDS